MPRISVCIPTFKNEETIEETLESVRSQSLKDYEIVQREVSGLANNLNQLVKESKGEILVFLSGDDILLPSTLEDILKEFDNHQIGMVIRPYYWFKDDWKKPLRHTKTKSYRPEDLIFLCGQLSGIAVKRELLTKPFKELTFVEFASGVLHIIKEHDVVVLNKANTAVRINSSGSMNSVAYENSPSRNWVRIVEETFGENDLFVNNFKERIASNFIGLLQIRMYGGFKRTMREVGIMFRFNPLIIYNVKFWFYLFLILLPSPVLIMLRNLFIFRRLK